MNRSNRTGQQLAGVFLLGLTLLFSPVLTLFDTATELAGIPVAYLYPFGTWLGLIIIAALLLEGRRP